METPVFLTIAEVARVLRMTEWEVRKRCRSGELKASKPARTWLIAPADVEEFVAAYSNQRVPA